ncbi:MAG TPA: ribosome silencing factor [Longimicrobiaceae bacterium]|jgi:ribosome-associated protein|nr:ribosome silencing factor [Longimicrobiaceae bacterium]
MSNTPVAPASLDLPVDVARAVDLLHDRKARDVAVLELKGISSATDWFVIATGTSDTHVSAIADNLIDELKKHGTRPLNVEGQRGGRWILIDYFDFVVHVFHPAAREFYQLERLWGDAPVHYLSDEPAQA